MNNILKLLKKINQKDFLHISKIIDQLESGDKATINKAQKLKSYDLYRIRKGKFRIIFSFNRNGDVIIENVFKRDDNTYKKL
jgi:mRNA-degrading endonuclease RelE of RelBE toxin-antitoxin system